MMKSILDKLAIGVLLAAPMGEEEGSDTEVWWQRTVRMQEQTASKQRSRFLPERNHWARKGAVEEEAGVGVRRDRARSADRGSKASGTAVKLFGGRAGLLYPICISLVRFSTVESLNAKSNSKSL
ncbi:hypothetical protein C7B61_15510 [filamentous cyanobacterium CCP1]|nr:hypothetical protein C7B76_16830 [filamentous cyanobacterium CCP2]PSB61735.1 hypothetical protein C7B61_15510 [filamentous cyanobacterium CCP1]